jgi:hypothetical protein
MWGQRTLHSRSMYFSGLAAAKLSPIEHSVSSKYWGASLSSTNLMRALVLPD